MRRNHSALYHSGASNVIDRLTNLFTVMPFYGQKLTFHSKINVVFEGFSSSEMGGVSEVRVAGLH